VQGSRVENEQGLDLLFQRLKSEWAGDFVD